MLPPDALAAAPRRRPLVEGARVAAARRPRVPVDAAAARVVVDPAARRPRVPVPAAARVAVARRPRVPVVPADAAALAVPEPGGRPRRRVPVAGVVLPEVPAALAVPARRPRRPVPVAPVVLAAARDPRAARVAPVLPPLAAPAPAAARTGRRPRRVVPVALAVVVAAARDPRAARVRRAGVAAVSPAPVDAPASDATALLRLVEPGRRPRRAPVEVVPLAAPVEVPVLLRPRKLAPWRCEMRYTDDSPTPKRLAICGTGVSVSLYRRVSSFSCSSLNLRNGERPSFPSDDDVDDVVVDSELSDTVTTLFS